MNTRQQQKDLASLSLDPGRSPKTPQHLAVLVGKRWDITRNPSSWGWEQTRAYQRWFNSLLPKKTRTRPSINRPDPSL